MSYMEGIHASWSGSVMGWRAGGRRGGDKDEGVGGQMEGGLMERVCCIYILLGLMMGLVGRQKMTRGCCQNTLSLLF